MVTYPMQIACVWGVKKSLSIDCNLQQPTAESDVPPLSYDGRSRFTVTVLDGTSGKYVAVAANIKEGDVSPLKAKTNVALMMKATSAASGGSNTDGAMPDNEPRFIFGVLKGKTPTEALLESAANKETLLQNRKFLVDNLNKYKNNQKTINAIDDAIKRLDNGELNDSKPHAASSMVVYDRKMKCKRKPGADGFFDCSDVNIECQFDMRYPWVVTIDNYKAKKNGNQIDGKSIKDRKSSFIRLSDDDFLSVVAKMSDVKNHFEAMEFNKLYERAIKSSIENANAAKAAKAAPTPEP